MNHPTHPTTLEDCNQHWPEALKLASWQSEHSLYTPLIGRGNIFEYVIDANTIRIRIQWDNYRFLYQDQDTPGLQRFYKEHVQTLIKCICKIENSAKIEAIKLTLLRKRDDAKLATDVAKSAALQKARYKWLPGNTYGNRWQYRGNGSREEE